jgi:PIN domain nuclease of toxin-antitoxin system
MKILLDTHAFLWLVMDDPKLSSTAKNIFLDNANEILLSAVSGFEIAVKYSLGKLELSEEPKSFVENRVQANALTILPVKMQHTLKLAELPFHHRDPFDRLLIAQALVENVPILSKDAIFSNYQELNCIW